MSPDSQNTDLHPTSPSSANLVLAPSGLFAHTLLALLRQRFLVLLAAVVLALSGAWAYWHLPIDAFPDISTTQVKVILKLPGMTPEEVEQRVAVPIEQEMLSIPNKAVVRSMSKYGIVDVTIDFTEGTDMYWARQQVAERLANVQRDLPSGMQGGLAPITTPLSEMFMFTVEGAGYSLQERREVLDWIIRPALRTVAGVADVNTLGGIVRAYEVIPDVAKLRAREVTLETLRDALQSNTRNDGAGRINRGEENWLVRLEGGVRSLEDLQQISLASASGERVTVGEVATVRMGSTTRYGAVSQNGQGEAVEGLVLGLRGANAQKLVEDVQTKLAEVKSRLPKGMRVQVFYNRGELVTRAAQTVIKALLEASVLVMVLLYVFLGGLRAALVVTLSLPLSILGTFLLMRWVGLTANLMSLGGLAIALGMLVDAAVVVVENIEAALARPHQTLHKPALLSVIARATQEVALPMGAGMLIIGMVFLPLLTLEGLEGKLFAPVAQTILLALGVSLLVAFTVVPTLSAMLLKPGQHQLPWLMRQLNTRFMRLQSWAQQHARIVYGVALGGILVAVVLLALVGKTFMPTMDEGDILVQVQKVPSVSLEASLELDTRVQQAILRDVPEVKAVVARVGSDDLGLDPMGFNDTDTFLVLKPKSEWAGSKEEIIANLRKVFEQFPGLTMSFTQPIEMRVAEMLTGSRGDIALKIFGTELPQLEQAAQQIAARLRTIQGASEVLAPRNDGMLYQTLQLDRAALARMGVNGDTVQNALRMQLEGETLGLVPNRGMRTPLVLRGPEALRSEPEGLTQLLLNTSKNAQGIQAWPLESFAKVVKTAGPVRIDHQDGARFALVQVNVDGRDLSSFVKEAQQAVADLKDLPAGLHYTWGGQFENQQRSAARLALVVPVALLAIFVVLMLTFQSMRQALLVLLNVPFAMVGGIAALRIAGEYLSVPASVGFIALLGIAVLNGVVMVTHYQELLRQGLSLAEVVVQGARNRLRPVLMTASITALGMIPLLYASGPGSEIQRPLAIVVLGGIFTSTALTLLLLPLLFARFGLSKQTLAQSDDGKALGGQA